MSDSENDFELLAMYDEDGDRLKNTAFGIASGIASHTNDDLSSSTRDALLTTSEVTSTFTFAATHHSANDVANDAAKNGAGNCDIDALVKSSHTLPTEEINAQLCNPEDVAEALATNPTKKTDLFLSLIPTECRDALIYPSTLYEEDTPEYDNANSKPVFDVKKVQDGHIKVDKAKAQEIFNKLLAENKLQHWVDDKVFTMFLCLVANMRKRGINKHGLLFNEKKIIYAKCLACPAEFDVPYLEHGTAATKANTKLLFGWPFGLDSSGDSQKHPGIEYNLHEIYYLYHDFFLQDKAEYSSHYGYCKECSNDFRIMYLTTCLRVNLARSIARGEPSLLKFMLYSDYSAIFSDREGRTQADFRIFPGDMIEPITMECQGSDALKKNSSSGSTTADDSHKRKLPHASTMLPPNKRNKKLVGFSAIHTAFQVLKRRLYPGATVPLARFAIFAFCDFVADPPCSNNVPPALVHAIRIKCAKILYSDPNLTELKANYIAKEWHGEFMHAINFYGDGYGLGVTKDEADAFDKDDDLLGFYKVEKELQHTDLSSTAPATTTASSSTDAYQMNMQAFENLETNMFQGNSIPLPDAGMFSSVPPTIAPDPMEFLLL